MTATGTAIGAPPKHVALLEFLFDRAEPRMMTSVGLAVLKKTTSTLCARTETPQAVQCTLN